MDVKKILNIVEQADPEVYERISPRRHILKSFTSKVAVASLPFAVSAFFKKAYGKNTDVLYDALAFALTLEYLEAAFYRNALGQLGNYPESEHKTLQKLASDEEKHVRFLQDFLKGTAGIYPSEPAFDFSGGSGSGAGPFATVYEDFQVLLTVAQVLEDTGVRAYKGQVPRIAVNSDILAAAINIHSVEARHAAHIRMLRDFYYASGSKPWITNNESNINSNFVQRSYNDEAVTIQAGIETTHINGFNVSAEQATQAFDEPLGEAAVKIIIDPFLVK